jgi:hypothetical protein
VTHGSDDDRPETVLDVDHTLVATLEQVESTVGAYLADLSEANGDALRDALRQLDDVTAASDLWAQSVTSSGAWGYPDKQLAIGQTAATPVVDHEDSAHFNAQVKLVQAAKAVVQHPDSSSVEALRAAWAVIEGHDGSSSAQVISPRFP